MSPHSARSSPRRPSWPDTTALESHESTGDSVIELKSLLPIARNASATSYTYSETSESVSDRQQEFTSKPAVFASTSTCQVSLQKPMFEAARSRQLSLTHHLGLQGADNHTQHQEQVQKHLSLQQRVKAMLACEPLLLATIFGVLLGILAGSLIRLGKPSSKAIDLIGKPIVKHALLKGQPVPICHVPCGSHLLCN